MKKYEVHVVSHTHWDREWHSTFQEFRMRLVKLVDKLLYILKTDPDYRYFVFDGQTIVLDDYLEIRPEREQELREFIKEGRLMVGPWYIQPDEFLVSGESLIRNLLIGDKSARAYGKVMKVGYIPDPFGHISQLPQVFQGFGIDSLIFTRGMGIEGERLGSEFIWQAPDKSEIIAIRQVGEGGYCNGAEIVHSRFIENAPFDRELSLKKAKELLEAQKPYANSKVLLINNGFDHLEPQANLPEALDFLNSSKLGAKYIHSTYDKYLDKIRARKSVLKKFNGELRKARYSALLHNVLSTRMYLKQENFKSQNMLERYAEPLAGFAMIEGREYPFSLMEQSWKYLLQSHPHDSICGCSTDEVHRDVVQRFHWSAQISDRIAKESMDFLAGVTRDATVTKDRLAVFNTLPWERHETVSIEGKEYDVKAPACGFAVYKEKDLIEERKAENIKQDYIGNSLVRVQPNTDGTLKIIDKRSGQVYNRMGFLEDIEDCGDEYNYSPLKKSKRLTTIGTRPKISVRGNEILIRHSLKLPRSLSGDRKSRSPQTTECAAVIKVFVDEKSPVIRFEAEIDNNALDHRVRAGFAAGIKTDYSLAESQFDVVKRGIKFNKGDWRLDMPAGTYPQQNFTLIQDKKKGMILVNKGLPEFELSSDGTLYQTLFRSVGWLSREDFIARKGHAGPFIHTPEAQCLGKNKYEYAIIPFKSDWTKEIREIYQYITPLSACKTNQWRVMSRSYLSLEPAELIMTALKRSEKDESIVVRFFNPIEKTVKAVLKVHHSIHKARLLKLDETAIRAIPVKQGEIEIEVKPKQIITVELIK